MTGVQTCALPISWLVDSMRDAFRNIIGASPDFRTIGNIARLVWVDNYYNSTINPKVDDIPESFGYKVNGVTLLIMGKSKTAASGCYCPENALLRRLLKHLIAERDEVVIVDMEAGIEHLTRGTAEGVDTFIVVVEPGQRSLQTAVAVKSLAEGLGVKKVFVIANKVRKEDDVLFIKNALSNMEFLGAMSFSDDVMESDIKGLPSYKSSQQTVDEVKKIKETLEKFI